MEPKFQTSFIPKKPTAPSTSSIPGSYPSSGTAVRSASSLFMTLAVLVFVLSLGALGGAFFWKSYLMKQQEQYKIDLADHEKRFNIDLISQLKQANVKIDFARQLMKNHIAVSQIFSILSSMTIESVRFLNLDVTVPSTQGEDVKVSMVGYGTNLASVAFQSDVLATLEQYGLRKIVKNPMLSNPSLDSTGTVSFGFSATIDPSSLSYQKSLETRGLSTASTTEQ